MCEIREPLIVSWCPWGVQIKVTNKHDLCAKVPTWGSALPLGLKGAEEKLILFLFANNVLSFLDVYYFRLPVSDKVMNLEFDYETETSFVLCSRWAALWWLIKVEPCYLRLAQVKSVWPLRWKDIGNIWHAWIRMIKVLQGENATLKMYQLHLRCFCLHLL